MRPPSHFGNDITNTSNGDNNAQGDDETRRALRERMSQIGIRLNPIIGKGVCKVVGRCEDAKENNNLDLSECQLIQVPDAVYHLMRHTELKTCDLSSNVITKIPPKFATKFSMITELSLSNNKVAHLPHELSDLKSLEVLDISHNSFITLPSAVFKMPKLKVLKANNNQIIEIDTDEIISSDSLEVVDLTDNPLTPHCYNLLKNAKVPFHIKLSERKVEDWEI